LVRLRSLIVVPTLAVLCFLALPGTALAGSIAVTSSGSLTFFAQVGEVNDLTVTQTASTDYTVQDAGAPITPGDGCITVDPNTVSCSGAADVFLSLVDGDDRAVLDIEVPSQDFGGDGADTLTGGTGPDELIGNAGADTLSGREGDDELNELTSFDDAPNTLDGGPGADLAQGGPGPDAISGGPGGDTLDGLGADDQVDGGDDNDSLIGGDGNDSLAGGAGDDEVGSRFKDPVVGTSFDRGSDTLDGGPGNDLLRPGLGPETLIPDADRLGGGDGFDTVTYDGREDPVGISLDDTANDGFTSERDDVRSDVESAIGGSSDDTLTGSPRSETLDGAAGSDALDGGAGNDELRGGTQDAGDDLLVGGDGDDRLLGEGGNDDGDGGSGADTLAGGDDADDLRGGPDDDQIAGGAGRDVLDGESGNDRVDGSAEGVGAADGGDRLGGGAGNDVLTGGEGPDVGNGGPGSDQVIGGAGADTATYDERSAGRVTVSLDGRNNDGGPRERDNVESDVENVSGGAVNDTFTGNRDDNRLEGAGGEDYVDGGIGQDDLEGGTAGDVVRARDGRADIVDCGRGRGADFAIVDPGDRVRRCETVENGRRTRPALGRNVVVDPERGSNQFGPAGIQRTVPLKDRLRIPVGSKVDARRGRVGLSSATGRGRQSADFSGGSFRVSQGRHRALTELRLVAGDFSKCRRPTRRGRQGVARASQRRRIARRLNVRARGRYRARGNHSAATVRGTVFTIADRCDGTLTVVKSGSVRVRDFTRNRVVIVRAGERYLAPAPR
jgi:Ca2+-binding RTX toxin-like protein